MINESGDPINPGGNVRARLLGMPRPDDSPLYELVQERLKGEDPVDWVLARRTEGMSWDKLALKLYTDTGSKRMVTAETLRNWALDAGAL